MTRTARRTPPLVYVASDIPLTLTRRTHPSFPDDRMVDHRERV